MALSMESSSNTLELGHSHNQLVTKKRKRFGKVILALAFVALLTLGCVVVVLYQREQSLPEPLSQRLMPSLITLETIMNGTYEPTRFNGTWVSDDEILTRNSEGQVILYNVTSGVSRVVIRDANLASVAGEVTLSADKKYLMVAFAMQRLYRHSTYSQYLVIDIQTQRQIPVTNAREEALVLNLVKWAPKGNGFAYVYYNNLFYRPNATTQEEYQLTTSGNTSIYHGICDWVYEEEILSDSNAMWFSPEGDKLAFASFNDMNVDVMSIPFYGEPTLIDTQYPKMYNIRYPKPGRPNPSVKVTIVDLNTKQKTPTRELSFSNLFTDPILSSVTWITNSDVALTVMNRVQNKARILSCSVSNVPCEEIIYLESKKGWLNLFTAPLFSSDGKRMVFILPWDQGNHSGAYKHVTLHDRVTNKTRPITHGRLTVTDILAWDTHNDLVYYQATQENNPRVRHLYRVNMSGDEQQSSVECLSCENNKQCTFATAALSTKSSHFVQTCSGPGVPTVNIYDKYNNKILTWEDNEHLGRKLKNVSMPEKQFVEVQVRSGMNAQVMLFIPPDIDKTGSTKYPLLVNVYGGPDSNQVFEKYKVAWETYLCLNRMVIIAFIDGRGSGLKGDDMLFANYRRLGSAEIEDQINVTRQLQKRYQFIDEKKSAIWGWSYGGYASGMALAMDTTNVFRCAVSVAPVTDWIYYDSVYTERYLGLPNERDNKKGYDSSSLVRKSRKLDGKKYLLIHGTMDDNVHYQQSMMLARSLELNDVLFRQQSYPDEAHSLSGVRHHVYRTLEAFLEECFN